MSSKSEDFPTPVSPRRMVYGLFVLFFEVLMIPFLRDSTLLGNLSERMHQRYDYNLLDSRGVTVAVAGGKHCARRCFEKYDEHAGGVPATRIIFQHPNIFFKVSPVRP
jgi:hypothetical protein